MNMSGAVGGKSFTASARLKSGPSFEKILKNVEWPEQFPFKPQDFQRFDESSDSVFYEAPRFVTHIDDHANAALTKYYSKVSPPSNTAGVSHFPPGYKQERIIGMGMNEEELKHNPVLTKCSVQDLNVSPKLLFEDNSFHIITNVVSVDYLTKPLDVFKEMCRILKPAFPTVVPGLNQSRYGHQPVMLIMLWLRGHISTTLEDLNRLREAVDVSPNPGRSDPMYFIYSRKLSAV